MTDQKNTILAIVLSALVFIVWQYFFGLPIQEKQKQVVQQQQQTQQTQPPATPSETRPQAPGQAPATAPTTEVSREAALAKSQRVRIATPLRSMLWAEYMHRIGMIKQKPASWKDFTFPMIHDWNGS